MILQVSEDINQIAIRVKSWRNQRYAQDWQNLYLIITPGQAGPECCCHQGGSPWIAYGCWPGHRTGVDLMNPPPPDFPAFFLQAQSMTDDKLVVFELPLRWRETVPFGRYSGTVRYQPMNRTTPVNMIWNLGRWHVPHDDGCLCAPPQPPAVAPFPPPCDIVHFDIDYGPRCDQHIIDRIDVEFDNDPE